MLSERRYSSLMSLIYEAGSDFARWPEALIGIARAYDAPTVMLAARIFEKTNVRRQAELVRLLISMSCEPI